MALIKLKETWTYLTYRQQDQYTEYQYQVERWTFDTVTRAVTKTTTTSWEDPSAPVADYSRPTTEEYHWECVLDSTTRRGYFHNGSGGFTITDTQNAVACGYTPQPLTLAVQSQTNVSAYGGNDGAVTLLASGGVPPYKYRRLPSGAFADAATFSALAAGTYNFETKDNAGAVASKEVKILQPAPSQPIYGCTDPEATNYDRLATHDSGLCEYPRRMDATLPQDVAVVCNPIVAELASAPTGKSPVKASVLLTLGTLSDTTELTVNGSLFRFSLTPKSAEFYDTSSLEQALTEDVVLADRYTITNPAPSQVLLEALYAGAAYTPVVECPDGSVGYEIVAGVDALRSQAKKEWGCYVEVWGCSGTFGAAVDKNTGVLMERIERLYSADNSYRFDLASVLRRNLRHGLLTESDRLQAYFLRYGEAFVAEGQTLRKRYPIGESAVLWALEGALPVTQQNSIDAPLMLNTNPGALTVPLHTYAYAEAAYVLAAGGIRLRVQVDYAAYDGTITTETITDTTLASGGVVKLALQPVFVRARVLDAAKKLVRCTVRLLATLGSSTTTLATNTYRLSEMGAQQCVVFVSSLGAYEAVWFEGYREEGTRRSADTYAKGVAAVTSPSGRSRAVRAVALEKLPKLHSALLDRASFDWLREELAASPDAFLFNHVAGTYQAINITGLEAKADPVEGEYYINIETEAGVPHNPLRN